MKNIFKVYKALGLSKSIKPILETGLYIDGKLKLTNLEVVVELPLEIKDANNILIDIPTLEKCEKLDLKNLKYIDGSIVCGDSGISVKLPVHDVDDFPSFDETHTNKNHVGFNCKDLYFLNVGVGSSSRFAINSIAFYPSGVIVATDGRRLHIVNRQLSSKNEKPFICPPIISKLAKIFKFDEFTQIDFDDKCDYASIENLKYKIKFRGIGGLFPDYKGVLPKTKQDHKIKISDLMPILKKIKKASDRNTIDIIHLNGDLTWNNIKFPLDTPSGLDHRYNYSYILDAISFINPDSFDLPKCKASTIKIENGNYTAIVTPINLVEA